MLRQPSRSAVVLHTDIRIKDARKKESFGAVCVGVEGVAHAIKLYVPPVWCTEHPVEGLVQLQGLNEIHNSISSGRSSSITILTHL